MNVELSYKSAGPAKQIGLWALVGGGVIAVVIGAFYVGTLMNKKTPSNSTFMASPTPWVSPTAPLYPSVTPIATTSGTATPSTTVTATPTAAVSPTVSYSVTLRAPLVDATYKHTMVIPKDATTTTTADGTTAIISYKGSTLSIKLFYEAYPVEYAAVTQLSTNMGTVYRATPKGIDTNAQVYSNLMTTSGTCNAMGDTLQSPCGTSAIAFSGTMNYLGIYTCTASTTDVSFCDNIVKSVSLTPITLYQTIELTDGVTGSVFSYGFLAPAAAVIKKESSSVATVTYASGAILTLSQRYEAFPGEYVSATPISGKITSLYRVVPKGIDSPLSLYVNNAKTSGTCPGMGDNVTLKAPCGLGVINMQGLNSMTEISCRATIGQVADCDNSIKTLEIYEASGP